MKKLAKLAFGLIKAAVVLAVVAVVIDMTTVTLNEGEETD